MAGIRIEKQPYSSNPWRLIAPTGEVLTRLVPYPGHSEVEMPPIWEPMAYATKAAAIEALGQFAWELRERLIAAQEGGES